MLPGLRPDLPTRPPRPPPPVRLSLLLAPAPPPACLPTSFSRLPVRLTCLHAPSQPAHLTLPTSWPPVPSRVVIPASHGERDDQERRRVRRRKEESREIRTKKSQKVYPLPPCPVPRRYRRLRRSCPVPHRLLLYSMEKETTGEEEE